MTSTERLREGSRRRARDVRVGLTPRALEDLTFTE